MTYGKEEHGDDNEFVHFEEGEGLSGDADEIIEESDEELVISERPGVLAAPQPPPVARKAAAKKLPAKHAKKSAAKKPQPKKKKAKAAPKKAARKKAVKKSGKRGKKR
jgi:hypothetical protein